MGAIRRNRIVWEPGVRIRLSRTGDSVAVQEIGKHVVYVQEGVRKQNDTKRRRRRCLEAIHSCAFVCNWRLHNMFYLPASLSHIGLSFSVGCDSLELRLMFHSTFFSPGGGWCCWGWLWRDMLYVHMRVESNDGDQLWRRDDLRARGLNSSY